jgi:hypothetical protein
MPVASRVRFAGALIVGGVLSMMVTSCVAVALLPAATVAV